jgi:hypothetical protein
MFDHIRWTGGPPLNIGLQDFHAEFANRPSGRLQIIMLSQEG